MSLRLPRAVTEIRWVPAAAAAFAVFATACLSIALLYARARDAQRAEVRQNLIRVAQAAAAVVDADLHRTFKAPDQERTENYRIAVSRLRAIRYSVEAVRFLYTVVLVDGQPRYVLDAGTLGNQSDQGSGRHRHIMEPHPAPDPALLAALRESRSTAEDRSSSDQGS